MKMLSVFLIIFVFVSVGSSLFAQEAFSRYYDINNDSDNGWKIIRTKDNYFVFSGNLCHQNTVPCSGLIKFDKNWDLIWKKELDSIAPVFMDCITTDNNYLFICSTTAANPGHEFKLLKYDLEGNLLISKIYGPYSGQIVPYTINYYNQILYFNLSFWHNPNVIGIDSTQVWFLNKDLELLNYFTDSDKRGAENMIGFLPCIDDNFIGFKSVQKHSLTTEGIVKKFDPLGKIIWASNIGGESKYPQNYSLQKVRPTSDNGCVGIWNQTYEGINNDTFPEQPILFKLESNGKPEWSHTFFSKRRKYFYSLFETFNGDIIGIGINENPGKTTRYKSTGWVVRFSKKGELIWEHSYVDTITVNGFSSFSDGIETENEELVFCGNIKPKKDSGSILNSDVWLVRTDKYGCLIPSCDSVQLTTKIIEFNELQNNRIVYTNPVINTCYIYSDEYINKLHIKIADLNGKTILDLKNVNIPGEVNIEDITRGLYSITFYTEKNELLKSSKLIKL